MQFRHVAKNMSDITCCSGCSFLSYAVQNPTKVSGRSFGYIRKCTIVTVWICSVLMVPCLCITYAQRDETDGESSTSPAGRTIIYDEDEDGNVNIQQFQRPRVRNAQVTSSVSTDPAWMFGYCIFVLIFWIWSVVLAAKSNWQN